MLNLLRKIKRLIPDPSQILSYLARTVGKSGGKTHALAPFLWLIGIWLILFILLLLWGLPKIDDVSLKYLIICIFVGVFIIGVIIYLIIYFRTPERLQSEWYRLEDKKLNMFAQKGGKISFEPVDLSEPPTQITGEQK